MFEELLKTVLHTKAALIDQALEQLPKSLGDPLKEAEESLYQILFEMAQEHLGKSQSMNEKKAGSSDGQGGPLKKVVID